LIHDETILACPTCGDSGGGFPRDQEYCFCCGVRRTSEARSTINGFTSPALCQLLSRQRAEAENVDRLLRQIAAQSHYEDRYAVREVLAEGGMGNIHRAYDQILQREVAIKMIRGEAGTSGHAIRGQFLKEARVGARLLHPHCLPVFDLGVTRSEQIYYTMRLVNGASLAQCLDSVAQGVMTELVSYPLRRIVQALVGVCEGVNYAHQHCILHLDLKPHNVLMSDFSEVFVIDWGLARVDDVDDTEALLDIYRERQAKEWTQSITCGFSEISRFQPNAVGTPGYMAPEQARVAAGHLNATTDVYGLGGILYFMLYGSAPNGAGTSPRDCLATASKSKNRGKLRMGILPSGRRIPQKASEAILALEAIGIKALEPRQDDRYRDVRELIGELNEWLAQTENVPFGS